MYWGHIEKKKKLFPNRALILICTVLAAVFAWKNTVQWGFQREK